MTHLSDNQPMFGGLDACATSLDIPLRHITRIKYNVVCEVVIGPGRYFFSVQQHRKLYLKINNIIPYLIIDYVIMNNVSFSEF